jgi:hypothetical protein
MGRDWWHGPPARAYAKWFVLLHGPVGTGIDQPIASYQVIASRAGGSSDASAAVSVLFGNSGGRQASGGDGLSLAA